MGSKYSKGQTVVIDFILSISVFILLLVVFYSVWMRTLDRMGDSVLQAQADEAARRGLSALVDSPGFPSNWAAQGLLPSDSALLGLGGADAPGVLDIGKISNLSADFNDSSLYNATRLKTGLSPFEADVRVYYPNGSDISAMGASPAAGATIWASGQRIATLGNETVLVRLRVWRNSP